MLRYMSDKPEQETILKKTAKAIGSAVGSVAAVAGVHVRAEKNPGRFPKTNKTRLPRREKKALARKHNVA